MHQATEKRGAALVDTVDDKDRVRGISVVIPIYDEVNELYGTNIPVPGDGN